MAHSLPILGLITKNEGEIFKKVSSSRLVRSNNDNGLPVMGASSQSNPLVFG